MTDVDALETPPAIQDVARLRLEPGDVLVFRIPKDNMDEERLRIYRDHLNGMLPGHPVLFISETADLFAVSPATAVQIKQDLARIEKSLR